MATAIEPIVEPLAPRMEEESVFEIMYQSCSEIAGTYKYGDTKDKVMQDIKRETGYTVECFRSFGVSTFVAIPEQEEHDWTFGTDSD